MRAKYGESLPGIRDRKEILAFVTGAFLTCSFLCRYVPLSRYTDLASEFLVLVPVLASVP